MSVESIHGGYARRRTDGPEGRARVAPRKTAWGAYKGIATAIRARIAGGEFPPESAVPSEAVLCGQYKVSRNTVRRALEELSSEGLIVAQPGRGRVVVGDGEQNTFPQYRTMAAELRASIESGELAPGDALPSESALAERYGVARGTARHALAELEGAGLVRSIHGKGRFVRESLDLH